MSLSRSKILIVDDESDITNLTAQFLHLQNYETISCHSGDEALNIIKERSNEISLVLLDIMMPRVSGYEVLEEIKKHEEYREILVVLFSVKKFQLDIQKAKELGADGYLPKAISGRQLLDYVTKILKKSEPN
jgi:DNA-binding response OmpR family regulator